MLPLIILSEIGILLWGLREMKGWLDSPDGQKAIDEIADDAIKLYSALGGKGRKEE